MSRKRKHIVIGGLPRSGTSMLRAIVGSHSEIAFFHREVPIWTYYYPLYGHKSYNLSKGLEVFHLLMENQSIKSTDVSFDKEELVELFKKNKDYTVVGMYEILCEYYLQAKKKHTIGLKTPYNEFHLPSIFTNYPNTKFIHVIRNPLDASVSFSKAKEKWWGGKINYDRHIYEWEKSAKIAVASVNEPNHLTVKYEDLLRQPAKSVAKICSFIDVKYEDTMLNMQGQSGWTGSNSSFEGDSKSNFRTDSIDRYKDNLPMQIQTRYFSILHPLLEKLCYEIPNEVNSRTPWSYRVKRKWYSISDRLKIQLKRSILMKPIKKVKSVLGK